LEEGMLHLRSAGIKSARRLQGLMFGIRFRVGCHKCKYNYAYICPILGAAVKRVMPFYPNYIN
jgi:hypothetical protein